MTLFSPLSEQLEPEGAFVYLNLAKRVPDVISFGIGQPDFKPPQEFVDAVSNALKEGILGYAPPLGYPELREKIAEYLNEKYGCDVRPEEVAVTVGAKSAVFMSLILLTHPGSEIILPDPGFPTYECTVRFAGGRPVFCPLRDENNFKMQAEDIESLITKYTRAILLNYPHNPTGAVLDEPELTEIIEIAKKNGLFIISDEIYEDYRYEGKHASVLQSSEWRDHCIYISGFSKTWAVPGFRLGILVANREIIEKIDILATNIYSCPPAPFQIAALKALDIGIEWFNEVRQDYDKRRRTVIRLLSKIFKIKCVEPKGAFYVFPEISPLLKDLGYKTDDELARAMLFEAKVLMLPGSAFPRTFGRNHLRISYVLPREKIEEGFERLAKWMEGK
ncbi:pyridoxal phosphate-dependent aminotransferase [Thermococcus barophilus]|nr:pyridoxal phosphate-dependent aminotransferase [Thermococcus barophilus]